MRLCDSCLPYTFGYRIRVLAVQVACVFCTVQQRDLYGEVSIVLWPPAVSYCHLPDWVLLELELLGQLWLLPFRVTCMVDSNVAGPCPFETFSARNRL